MNFRFPNFEFRLKNAAPNAGEIQK